MMPVPSVENLLREIAGLDAGALGAGAVERAVQRRLAATHIDDLSAYVEFARRDSEELQELIEAVVVPETWFFRGAEALTALAAMVQQRAARSGGDPIRVLSLPCATGEEPYSIAIALAECGVPLEKLSIDAVDISTRALALAREGNYGANSFRGADPSCCARYFSSHGNLRRISDALRGYVHFHRGNLLDTGFLATRSAYDFIFCRNLLIYFNADAQARAVSVLRRLLRCDGVLFVGSSEAGLLMHHGFCSARLPMAFAFHHPEASSEKRPPADEAKKPRVLTARAARRISMLRPADTRIVDSIATPSPADDLRAATQLADAGRFEQAAQLCTSHLRAHPTSVEGFYLLGVIEDARGKADVAADLYRKVLYLDPRHEAAALHLAYVLVQRGENVAADVLRKRLRRRQDGSK